jgi:very-short-patch-repair endonuclease
MNDQPTNYQENLFRGATITTFKNARTNRKTATETEALLWQELRGKKINGYKFRRQHPVDTFIADFYCHEKKLVIEIDGEYHYQNDQPQYDAWRTEILENLGITVIRFSNYEVENEIEKVKNLIKELLQN